MTGTPTGWLPNWRIQRTPGATVAGAADGAIRYPDLQRRLGNVSDMTSVVHSDPEILGGKPVFVGTRVPLRNLIDYLEGNHSIEEFMEDFPSVSRAQVIAVLEALEAATPIARPA